MTARSGRKYWMHAPEVRGGVLALAGVALVLVIEEAQPTLLSTVRCPSSAVRSSPSGRTPGDSSSVITS